jgi:hypothetical protein
MPIPERTAVAALKALKKISRQLKRRCSEALESSVKINFWFAALTPFVSAVVAFATAAAMMRGSRINSSNRAAQAFGTFVDNYHERPAGRVEGDSAVRCRTVEIAFGARAGLRGYANKR